MNDWIYVLLTIGCWELGKLLIHKTINPYKRYKHYIQYGENKQKIVDIHTIVDGNGNIVTLQPQQMFTVSDDK